jgi:hypothetical protein
MKANEIQKELKQLPLQKRIYAIERAIRSIREEEQKDQTDQAVEDLYEDYKNDMELTVFTDIDLDNFYETK